MTACLLLAGRGVTAFRLQLVGDTNWGFSNPNPFSGKVDALVADLEALGVEVTRMGHLPRNEIAEALTRSDIHVTPSRWDEPLGLTTLEGLASGQAVVGSATGGTPELLGGAGRLFPREDPEALADLLEELILDPALRASWGRRARARAESLTWQRTWDGIAARPASDPNRRRGLSRRCASSSSSRSASTTARSGPAPSRRSRDISRASWAPQGHASRCFTPDDGGTLYAEGHAVRLRHGSAHRPHPLVRKAWSALARAKRWTWHDYGPYYQAVTRQLRQLDEPVDAIVIANDPLTADRLARRRLADHIVLWLHNRLEGAEARPFESMASTVQVVAVSQSVADWTKERHMPRADIRVIRSGVDHDLFHPRPGWLEITGPVRVVCHGRIDPNKGHEVAAEAVERLRAKGLPVELTVIGQVRTFGFSKEDEEAYGRRVSSAVQQAGGTIVGWMPHADLAAELRLHDVACVLSRVHEPFALSTLEAMASGCALIATRMGGIPEAVGSAGALVPAESPDAVADVLEAWVRDRTQLAAMKQAAVERAADFTWSATAAALVELLDA